MADTACRLGISLGVAPPSALMTVIQELGRRVATVDLGDVHDWDPVLIRPEWGRAPAFASGRVAWWLDDFVPEVARTDSRFPAIALSTEPGLLRTAAARGIRVRRVVTTEVEPESSPVAPFVRERIRRARGLGPGWLVQDDAGTWTWNGSVVLDSDSVSTALAVCAAVRVADERSLVRAMAWGAPTIATPGVALAVGATDGEVVTEGTHDSSEALGQVERVASNPLRSARLSRRGRERYAAAPRLVSSVDDVVEALELASRWRPSSLEIELDRLDARRGAGGRRRFDEMVSSIVDEG